MSELSLPATQPPAADWHAPANLRSRWRVAADAALRLHYWDGECVLFHGAAGDTHRLPEAVGQLLERLLQAPCTGQALSEAIDLHEDDVRQSLAELALLGVVERAA